MIKDIFLVFVDVKEKDFTPNDIKQLELNGLTLNINEDIGVDTSRGMVRIENVDSYIEEDVLYLEVGVYNE